MDHKTGSLFLLPSPISDQSLSSISEEAITILHRLDYFIVERARTSRRYLRATGLEKPIDQLIIEEIPKAHIDPTRIKSQLRPLQEGHDMGLLSEAGMPAVADPGRVYVSMAHRLGARVIPVSGPSSIMMALIASGLEGQRFMFHGYLSAKREKLENQFRQLQRRADQDDATQIWIEAPYRNRQIMEAAEKHLDQKRNFCIAAGIGSLDGFIATKTISDWQHSGWPNIHKIPTVFLLR